MEPAEAWRKFVVGVLVPSKAERLASLIQTRRGQLKALDALSHDFHQAVRADVSVPRRDLFWQLPCLVFQPPSTFGAPRPSFASAYEELSTEDGWLVVSEDGRFGIYRPEGRWDDERTLAA
jgi:hypothetical protein